MLIIFVFNSYTNNQSRSQLVTTETPKTTEEHTYKITSLGANPSAQAPVNLNSTLDYQNDELNEDM